MRTLITAILFLVVLPFQWVYAEEKEEIKRVEVEPSAGKFGFVGEEDAELLIFEPALYSLTGWTGLLNDTGNILSSSLPAPLYDDTNATGVYYGNNANQTHEIVFKEPRDITSVLGAVGVRSEYGAAAWNFIMLKFYDKNDELLSDSVVFNITTESLVMDKFVSFSFNKNIAVAGVKRIEMQVANAIKTSNYIYEFEILGESISYESVSDFKIFNISHNAATINYKNPASKFLKGNKIEVNGKLVYDGPLTSSYLLKDLEPGITYSVKVSTVYTTKEEVSYTGEFKTLDKPPEKPTNVTDLKAEIIDNEIVLSYAIPENVDHLTIYKDGKLLADKYKENRFVDKADYEPGKTYVYKVISVNAGGSSLGSQVSLKVPTKEITELKATATAADVELFWTLPEYTGFDLVSIYRKEEKSGLARVMLFASDSYDPIFQTNGTYFRDMTVAADKPYEYKLTTLDKEGKETEGVTISVRTKKVVVGGTDIKEEGDFYVVSWGAPTKGKLKIIIGGSDYKTVDAALLEYKIPKADVVYDKIGIPDIKLVPVAEDGTVIGTPTSPGGGGGLIVDSTVTEVLNAANLLKYGVALLGVIGGFVLLALAFRVVPKLTKTIRTAYDAKGVNGRRMNND